MNAHLSIAAAAATWRYLLVVWCWTGVIDSAVTRFIYQPDRQTYCCNKRLQTVFC